MVSDLRIPWPGQRKPIRIHSLISFAQRTQRVRAMLAREERFKLHLVFCPRVSFFPLCLSPKTAEKTAASVQMLGHSHSPCDTSVRESRKGLQLRYEESSCLNRSLKDTAEFLDKAAMIGALAAKTNQGFRGSYLGSRTRIWDPNSWFWLSLCPVFRSSLSAKPVSHHKLSDSFSVPTHGS